MKMVRRLSVLRNRSGATAIEYGLIAGLIAVVVVGGMMAVGSATSTAFETVSQKGWGS
jgi:pilus assembly protein Flp/PilA